MPNKDACLLSDEQARQTLDFCFPELLFHRKEFSQWAFMENMMYLCPQIIKTKQDMEVISIERSTYKELLTSFNSFVTKMKETAKWGYDLETQLLHQSASSCLSPSSFDSLD